MVKIAWMSEEKDQKVLCKACMQRCVLKEGEYGKCGVRLNIGGELYLTVYGLVSALNIDPVEKKPLYHFLPGTATLSSGHRRMQPVL
jgi:pyruvate formate lyase activating enzyme